MTQEMPGILKTAAGMDEAAAKQYITDYCNAMQDQAFTDAGQILNDVLWYRSRNSNTMKNGRNPETGETLEEAVCRESLEETGIRIKNVRYFASQPWPYPCGLMVGFNADYDGGEIHLQKEEIAKGGWFRKDNLPRIPEKLSIARMLLDAWLEEER